MVLKITNLHILRYLPTYWLYLLERYTIDNQRCTHTASFLRKIEDLTFFLSTSSEQRGKRQKQPFQAPTDPVYKDRACRGLFRQNGL